LAKIKYHLLFTMLL